jgi:hypothetical protein
VGVGVGLPVKCGLAVDGLRPRQSLEAVKKVVVTAAPEHCRYARDHPATPRTALYNRARHISIAPDKLQIGNVSVLGNHGEGPETIVDFAKPELFDIVAGFFNWIQTNRKLAGHDKPSSNTNFGCKVNEAAIFGLWLSKDGAISAKEGQIVYKNTLIA